MKYFGKVGFVYTEETVPGVWEEVQTEKDYYGDVLRYSKSYQTTSEKVNDDVNFNNQISILTDPFAMNHFQDIKYLEWMGAYWKITSVEIQYPRLILTIGGVYNGKQA